MRRLPIISVLVFLFMFDCAAQDFERLKEINTGPNGSSYPFNFTTSNNKLFFIASDPVNYTRLWVTEGTEATTRMLGPAGGVIGSISGVTAFKNKVFFTFNDGVNGLELWVSDGTVAGTKLFKDIYPGSNSSFPRFFTVANNKLFFMADEPGGERRLWVSDGTVGGTIMIRPDYIDIFNGLNAFAILNNEIYFSSSTGTGSPAGLWKSDGTAAGTKLVSASVQPGVFGCNYAVLNSKLYFSGFDLISGGELWVTDGTGAGTHLLKNIAPDGGGVYGDGVPPNLTVFNSKIYFAGKDDANGAELWVSDGTAAGTHLVKDIYPGVNGSQPIQMIVYNGSLYMLCNLTNELWQSDGTAAGTVLVKTGLYYSRFAGVWNDKMYIANQSFDNAVWESDGTTAGTVPAKANNISSPIYSMGSDLSFTTYNGDLYFSGSSPGITLAYEPCKLTLGAAAVKAFTFTGTGNWSNPANWKDGKLPPATLPAGYSITITGSCILDITQHAQAGSTITVASGGSLLILGSLTMI